MKHRVTRPLAPFTLPLLLFACGQTPEVGGTGPSVGADHSWSFTAPGGRVAALTLTPGWNTLQYETPTFMANGWGPAEKNHSNGERAAGDGRPLTLNGVVYALGFGVHALSQLSFDLTGTYRAQCTRFTVNVGVDDEVGARGSVVFQVFADGDKLYDSGVMTGTSATKRVDLDITGRRELRLEVTDAGNGGSYDHADWADPRVLCAAGARGTPGTLDPGFRRVQTQANPLASAVQSDGKVLLFGSNPTPDLSPDNFYTPDFFVARYNRDGGLDPTFGKNGVVTIVAGVANTARRVAVQPDGNIVAVGVSVFPSRPRETRYVSLLRLLPNGQPDPGFRQPGAPIPQTGIVFTSLQEVSDFAPQPGGGFVLVDGVRGENTFGVVRFLESGAPDPGFGTGGRVTVPLDLPPGGVSATVAATAVTVQPDGRIVAGGVQRISEESAGYGSQVFARLLPGGQLDASFGGDGRATGRTERYLGWTVDDLLVQPNGKILVSGEGTYDTCILDRLNPDGSEDGAFAGSGTLGRRVTRVTLALQADEKVLLAGCAEDNMEGEVVQRLLQRRLPGGQPDPSFGDAAGTVIVEDTRSVLLQPDGKIVVGLNPVVRLFP